MPSRKFQTSLNGNSSTIEVKWKFFWKDIHVLINDQRVLDIPRKKDLDKGVEFSHEGNHFKVQFKMFFMTPQLVVEINHNPVEGSGNDPVTMVRSGQYLILFLIGLNMLVGSLSIFGQVQLLQESGYGIYNYFAAAVYLLFFVISRKFNLFAGILGCLLYFGMDWVISVITLMKVAPNAASSGAVMRLILGSILFFACKGAYKLQGKIVGHKEVSLS